MKLMEEIRTQETVEKIYEPIFITDLLLNVKKSDNYEDSDEEEEDDDEVIGKLNLIKSFDFKLVLLK